MSTIPGFAIRANAPKQTILVQKWMDSAQFPLDGGNGNGKGASDPGNKEREVLHMPISRELPNRTLWVGSYHNSGSDSWFVRMRLKFWLGGTKLSETDLDFGWSIAEMKLADPDYTPNFYLTISQPGTAQGTYPNVGGAANQPWLWMASGINVPVPIPSFDFRVTADAISLNILRFSNPALSLIIYGLSMLSQSETL
jgi:hypothetical protein